MLQQVLKTYWGYDSFLPLQLEAMQCVIDDRDSLVVLPTGGGKSMCYQAPALCREGLAVVVSPLIALMKDQVDGLLACGIPAAAINSAMSGDERRDVVRQIESGRLRLLYVSPERLLSAKTIEFLQTCPVSFFAVDEAHCISAWGHDFRPEYRDLNLLRQSFPDAAVHAYTATATDRVRSDIAEQLGLRQPTLLVGDFHRPNLHYHVAHRERGLNQVCSVLDRFRGQSGIVYCITRADVEKTCNLLREMGYSVQPYHAGMTDEDRTLNQDAFLTEQADVIVATIAFGMGIDKSNVRCVIHFGMPKSLENYQQESGRAGRDGVEAECWLLHSGGDLMTWKRVIQDGQGQARDTAEASLQRINSYCTSVTCRHASLVEHFGQTWNHGACGACDVCLGKLEVVADALTIGQKILSCVYRVKERFGAGYVSNVLAGSREKRILNNRHDQLSTWGILSEYRKQDVRQWIEQLINQGFLVQEREYQMLHITDMGHVLLQGNSTPTLLTPIREPRSQTPTSVLDSWEGVDLELFEVLRALRRAEGEACSVPSYIIFSDATLRDMSRRRPSTVERFLDIHGVGQQKSASFGPQFVNAIIIYCQEHNVALDVDPQSVEPLSSSTNPSAGALQSFPLFDQGLTVEQIAEQMQLAISTTNQYLEAYIHVRGISDVTRWISEYELEQIQVIAQYAGTARLKPIHEALHSRVPYETIRIAIACLKNRRATRG
jgi:ATP-dependent DNA helicase RecQ